MSASTTAQVRILQVRVQRARKAFVIAMEELEAIESEIDSIVEGLIAEGATQNVELDRRADGAVSGLREALK